jgi:hypothetical protein
MIHKTFKKETNLTKKIFTRYREQIFHVKVLSCSHKIARYTEILVIWSLVI